MVWEAKWTVRGYEEPHSDEGCFAAAAVIQGVRMVLTRCVDMRETGHEAFTGFLSSLKCETESNSLRSHQKAGNQNMFWTEGVLCGRYGKHCLACGRHCDAGRKTSQISRRNEV